MNNNNNKTIFVADQNIYKIKKNKIMIIRTESELQKLERWVKQYDREMSDPSLGRNSIKMIKLDKLECLQRICEILEEEQRQKKIN